MVAENSEVLSRSDDQAGIIAEKFREKIADPEFPCVGAKSALARGLLEVIVARDMRSGWDDLRVHARLLQWTDSYRADPDGLRSLAVIFSGPDELEEDEFEDLLWTRLQSFADKDEWLGQPYDARVSADPEDPHFSLSFGGEAYFVVGLHPGASRPARQFDYPVMVFNLHDQFEKLRDSGRYASRARAG